MARIFPFRALRYSPSLVRVEECVTQPYDKISPAMQQRYYAASPYNLVRIILGLPYPTDMPGENDVYTRAAHDLNDWREAGVLAQDAEPALYAYSQRFTVPGTGAVEERRGVLCLGAVVPYEAGIVHRHEQTHTRARTDRMQLLRATRAHFGQIFMLYSDPAHTVESLLFPKASSGPDIEVEDEYGTLHRVWKVDDVHLINLVQTALADKKLIIADGHHRYETALAYAAEKAPQQANASGFTDENDGNPTPDKENLTGYMTPPFPESAVLMTLVNMDSEGLVILPTHRIVHGLKNFSTTDLLEQAQRVGFLATKLPSTDPSAALEALAGDTSETRIVALTRDGALLLSLDAAAREKTLPELLPRRRELDLVVLHELILARLLGVSAEAVRAGEHVRYERNADDAAKAVANGEADVAFLVNPVRLDQLRDTTFAGEVMPQKSTDFYPKMLSGLAIYALDAGREQ